jgi:hypothetical protein
MKLAHSLFLAAFGAALVAAVDVAPAKALVLTFDNLSLPDYGSIPTDYGSYAAGPSSTYLQGNGYTPNVGVSYSSTFGSTVKNYLSYWSTGYGSLVNVAYPVDNGSLGEIRFIANPGYEVTLNSFDLASWGSDLSNDTLRILDGSGNVLFNPFGGSPYVVTYAGGMQFRDLNVSASELRLQWGNQWDIGIDNVNFDERVASSNPVPAPPFVFGYLGMVIAAGYKRLFGRKKAVPG